MAAVIREIEARSLLRRQKRIDSWFVAPYGMNLYRGCVHGCAYCDGRAERYYVEGEFGRDVEVKVNALELLRRELDPARRRKPLARGYVFLGGGVGDSYQPAEETYRLARGALEILLDQSHPVHVLTKSSLVLRDAELIRRIHDETAAIVSVSLSSVDEAVSAVFEPGVPPPRERLEALRAFRRMGVPCGVYLMPVLPGITDGEDQLATALEAIEEAGVSFVCFGGLTLRPGRQKDFYLEALGRYAPRLIAATAALYPPNPWGQAARAYCEKLERRFFAVSRGYRLPLRLPPELYWDLLEDNDRVLVALEHVDYLLRIRGRRGRFGAAARAVAALREPLPALRDRHGELHRLEGIDPAAAELIAELLQTGSSKLYDALLRPWVP